jgi:transposase
MEHDGLQIRAFEVKHLPIVSAFAQKLGLVQEIDRQIKGEMDISPGRVVLAIVLDALSGRSPLFRLREFYENKDTELLLGEEIEPSRLSDWTLGRVLDRLYDYGTSKILTPIAVRGCSLAQVSHTYYHFDTTSIRVWGDFDPRYDDPFLLTRGYSKDKRPDLKQFIFSLLTVKGGLPVRFSCEDGNQSDRRTSNDVLGLISNFLSDKGFPGLKAFIADSAMITPDNLPLLENIPFISRLPATYAEHHRVVTEAVKADAWTWLGPVANTPDSPKRPSATYKAYDTTVTLYGKEYRAVVFHSSAHDHRRLKRIQRQIAQDQEETLKRCRQLEQQEFFCLPDAEKAAQSLKAGAYHRVETTIRERPVYGRGRPPAQTKRVPKSMRYRVETTITQDDQAIEPLLAEAGCFVLLAHKIPPSHQPDGMGPREILMGYKEQTSIEQGFRFLKDPMILDSLFLKTPQRIEALGLILVLALLIWRLLQFVMRASIEQTRIPVQGWQGKPTTKPTAFMMTTKFSAITIVVVNNIRYLNDKLTEVQMNYLRHLGLSKHIFTKFPARDPPENKVL